MPRFGAMAALAFALSLGAPAGREGQVLTSASLGSAGAPPIDGEAFVTGAILGAYARCARTIRLGGGPLDLRLPFAQEGERDDGQGYVQAAFRGGKGRPEELWERIGTLLESGDFAAYAAALGEPGEKVVEFDLAAGSWRAIPLAEFGEAGPGPSPSEALVRVVKRGYSFSASDAYDYLYCVGSVGLDCSGFVYRVLEEVARALGADLGASLAPAIGIDADEAGGAFGLPSLDPARGLAEAVSDAPAGLRPGDVLLFRGKGGAFGHSAVIASADRSRGVVRYLQCTDWAPRGERGVHDSFLAYCPAEPPPSSEAP